MEEILKECRHFGDEQPAYCEKCYQDLIAENARLQNINKPRRKIDCKNRIIIPTNMLNKLGIQDGDTVLVDIIDGKITIEKEK